jgi:hypothetical protein
MAELYEKPWFSMDLYLVGGFKHLEKYESQWEALSIYQ